VRRQTYAVTSPAAEHYCPLVYAPIIPALLPSLKQSQMPWEGLASTGYPYPRVNLTQPARLPQFERIEQISSASEVTTLWRYTNLFIIIIIIIFSPPAQSL